MAHDAITEELDFDDIAAKCTDPGKYQPGVIYSSDDISNHEYHAGPGISSTNIKHALVSPQHYLTHKQHPKPSTSSMVIGQALHSLILEPDKFRKEFILSPYDNFRSKEAKEWRAAVQADGFTVLTNLPGKDPYWQPGDYDLIHQMRDAIMRHEFAPLFLQHFVPETSVYWFESVDVLTPTGDKVTDMQLLLKARFDIRDLAHHLIADLKTTVSAAYSDFIRHVFDYGYHISERHYMRGAAEIKIEANNFVFIAIEKEPPFGIGLYTLDEEAKRLGEIQRRKGLESIAAAIHFNQWPAYPVHDRQLQTPPWMSRQKVY